MNNPNSQLIEYRIIKSIWFGFPFVNSQIRPKDSSNEVLTLSTTITGDSIIQRDCKNWIVFKRNDRIIVDGKAYGIIKKTKGEIQRGRQCYRIESEQGNYDLIVQPHLDNQALVLKDSLEVGGVAYTSTFFRHASVIDFFCQSKEDLIAVFVFALRFTERADSYSGG